MIVYLTRVVVPFPKKVINLPRTYKKLHCGYYVGHVYAVYPPPPAAAAAATTPAAHGAKNQRTQSPTLSTEIIINTRRFFNNSDNEANPSARMGF